MRVHEDSFGLYSSVWNLNIKSTDYEALTLWISGTQVTPFGNDRLADVDRIRGRGSGGVATIAPLA